MNELVGFERGCAGSGDYIGNRASTYFPQPFLDYSSTAVPRTLRQLWDWSEFMYLSSEVREIHRKLFGFFLTDIQARAVNTQIKPLDDLASQDWVRLFDNRLRWGLHGEEMLHNWGTYGNDFISLVVPIRRYLICPRCGAQFELEAYAKASGSDFKYYRGKYTGRCQSILCKSQGRHDTLEFQVDEVRTSDASEFYIKHWPVREMELVHYSITDETFYYWNPPEAERSLIKKGDLHTLATVDRGIIAAVEQNKSFKFRPDRLFHAKEPTLSGIKCRGWGIPRTIYMAKQQWTLQLMRKNIQALGIDFVVPMRLLTPSTQAAGNAHGIQLSPNTAINAVDFQRIMARIRAAHRRDPTQVHAVQVPVEYRLLGGEATQLFPESLLTNAKNDLIEAGGFSPEIYSGSLTVQAAPVGLRLFQSTNRAIPRVLNEGLNFIAARVSEFGGKDSVYLSHEQVSIVDNMETWLAQLQMATAGQLSMELPLRRLGTSVREDMQRRINEARLEQDAQEEMHRDMESRDYARHETELASQGGGAALAQGGEGGEGDPDYDPYEGQLLSTGMVPGTRLEEMQAQAVSLSQLLASADNMTRQRELQIAREQYPEFHSLLISELNKVRRRAAAEGQQMILEGQ